MTKAGQGEIDIVPVMGGFRSTVDSEVETTGKTSSNRFAAAFGNGIKGLGSFVGKSLSVAGGLAAGIAAVAVKGGISRQLQIEEATAKMSGLGNSTETVKSAMDSALASVKGTAFGMGEAATVASTALASGIEPGQRMSQYLTLVADAATIAGTGMGEMGTIMGKVSNTGKVTNDVLNQFGDRGVGVLQMLAKEYGVTAEEMTSMVSKGKVDAATFEKVLTENLGGAAQKSGETTKGAWKNMLAALSRGGVTLSSGFFPLFKSALNQVTLTLDGMNEKIKPAAEAFGKWFQGKAGPAIDGFSTKALAAFDKTIGGVSSFVLAFQAGGSDVTSSGFNGFLERMGLVSRFVFDEMRGGVLAFGAAWAANDGDVTSSGFPAFMERAAYFARGLVEAFRALDFSSVQNFFASVGPSSSQAGTAFSSIGSSLVALGPAFTAFGEQLPVITGALVKLGGVSLNLLVGALAFLAAHVDTIIAWMPVIVAGFIAWRIASSALAVSQYKLQMAQAAAAPVLLANNILRYASVRAETALSVAQGRSVATSNLSMAAMARQKVVMVASAVATGAVTAAQWLLNAAMTANPIGLIIAAVVALIAIIVLLVLNWDTVVGFLQGVWSGFVAWFMTVMAGFLAWWGGVWAAVTATASNIWNGIVAFFQSIPDRLLAGLIAVALFHIQMGQWIGSMKDAAIAKFLEMVLWTTGLPGQILGAMGNLNSLLVGAGGQIIQGFLDGLQAGFENVKNFVGGIGEWIAQNKGPEAYDKALLVPAGGWIMGGLNKSLKAGIPELKGTLGAVSATIRAGVSAPTSVGLSATSSSASSRSGAALSERAPIQIVINPAPGMSETTIGQIVADRLNHLIRRAG